MRQTAWLGAALVAEAAAAAVMLVLASWPWVAVGVVLHVLAAMAAARTGAGLDERFVAFALVLAIPALGVIGLAATRLSVRAGPDTSAYRELHLALADLPSPEQVAGSLDHVSAWVQEQVSVQPLADAIGSADPHRRRWAVGLLEERADAASVVLLRQALDFPDHDTAMAASAALRRIEDRLTRAIAAGRERTGRSPGSAPAWLTLGDACGRYRESGLLDATAAVPWLEEADRAYRRALALEPGSSAPAVALARAALAAGQAAEAEALARETLRAGPSPDATLVLAEVLHGQQRWAELRAVCAAAVAAGGDDPLIVWWSGKPVASA